MFQFSQGYAEQDSPASIASFQLVQNKLSWMLREITKGQLLAYHLGKKKDDGLDSRTDLSCEDEQCGYGA